MTLTEFISARLDEDEAAIREVLAPDVRWHDRDRPVSADDPIVRVRDWSITPARVLAEVEAKRRIVAMGAFSDDPDSSAVDWWMIVGSAARRAAPPAIATLIDVVKVLALPYADHPDYDEAWRV